MKKKKKKENKEDSINEKGRNEKRSNRSSDKASDKIAVTVNPNISVTSSADEKRRHVDNNSHRNIDIDVDTKRSPVQRGGSDKVKETSTIENMSDKGEAVEDWVQERYKPEDDGNNYTRGEENIHSSSRSSYRNSRGTYYSKEHDRERQHYHGNDTNGEQYYNSSHRHDRKRTRHND